MRSSQKEIEPFFIHFMLKPNEESSIIYKLIEAFSYKLQSQNQQFGQKFNQKQQRLSRHKQKLQQINDMSQDDKLRDKILQQIELKEYEKQFQKLLINKNTIKKTSRANRHFFQDKTNQKSQIKEAFEESNKQKYASSEKYELLNQSSDKRFRMSLIKKNSFSSNKIKKGNISNFEKVNNTLMHNLRNSQDLNSLREDNEVQKSVVNKYILEKQKNINNKLLSKADTYVNSDIHENLLLKNKFHKAQQKYVYKNKVLKDQFQVQDINKQLNSEQQIKNQKKDCKLDQQQIQFCKQNIDQGVPSQKKFTMHTKRTNNQKAKIKQQQILKNKFDQQNILFSNYQQESLFDNPYHYKNFTKQLNTFHYSSITNKSKYTPQNTYKSKHPLKAETNIVNNYLIESIPDRNHKSLRTNN